MLDLKRIRTEPEFIRQALARRGDRFPLDELLRLDAEHRELLAEVEELKARRNEASQAIGEAKRRGEDAAKAIAEMKQVSQEIKQRDEAVSETAQQLRELLLRLPNIPHPSVPDGISDADNVEVRSWGEPPQFTGEVKAHWDIGAELGLFDFERGAKVAGARFVALTGMGARLERALMNFMLDLHVDEHGYEEVFPPFLVNEASMTGTGQLPKFAEDVFRCEGRDLFLVPTAEVPVTNLYRDEILSADQLPIYHAAYSACFRAEAGAHGRDTRGLIRLHQFNKVELVKFVKPETSYDELEKLVRNAETVLQRLELPYRVVDICTGDVGFAAAKKYDPEVWMPSYNRYVEISSCSNFEDFQARRANIRYRPAPGERPQFVHTLNGSGLAVGRTLAAILENHLQGDGTVRIPAALRPYLGGKERIEPPTKVTAPGL